MNAKEGGLAGRKIVVDTYDSKLSADDARNSIIEACSKDFATVGTAALFVNNVDDLVGCKDSKGAATGMPDFPVVTTEIVHQCSPVSFGINPPIDRLRDQGPAPADLSRQPRRDELVPQEVRQERAARALPVPVGPEVGEEHADPCLHVATEGGHQAGPDLRRFGSGPAERVHTVRAGDEGQRCHLRPRRLERRERHRPPQGSEDPGREHGEGVGLLAAVLRQGPRVERERGRHRRPVRVDPLHPVRGGLHQQGRAELPQVHRQGQGRRILAPGVRVRPLPA